MTDQAEKQPKPQKTPPQQVQPEEEVILQQGRGLDIFAQLSAGDSIPPDPRTVLRMQSLIGNRATSAMLQRSPTPTVTHRTGSVLIQRGGPKDKMRRILNDELDILVKVTEQLFAQSERVLHNLASKTNGIAVMGPLKSPDRVKEKADKKLLEVDDAGKKQFDILDVGADIKDILRATIVYDNFEDLQSGYPLIFQELKGMNIVNSFVKFTEMFGQGKEAASGYRDAKLVFNWDIPPSLVQKMGSMLGKPKVIPMELQFNTKAALAVKSGHLYPSIPGFEQWDYTRTDDSGNKRFDAKTFVEDLFNRAKAAGNEGLFTQEDWQLVVRLPDKGLVGAHDVYEPKKKALMDPTDVANAEKFYPQIYDLAYRFNNWDQDKGNAMAQGVEKTKKKATPRMMPTK